MLFFNSAALIEFVGIKVKILHESVAPKKRDKTVLLAGHGFLRRLRNLREWRRQSPHTVQWSHREAHSLIKTLARPAVADKNWPFSNPSTAVVLDYRREKLSHVRGLKRLWGDT